MSKVTTITDPTPTKEGKGTMNANTAIKLNDAIHQAIECGESIEDVHLQVQKALDRAVEQRPTLDSQVYFYALGVWHDASLESVEKSDIKILFRGCASEAAWFSFETSGGEEYLVEVQRRKRS